MTRAANLAEAAGSGFAFRNRIINGDMRISQRGSSFAGISSGQYTLDRWKSQPRAGAVVTVSQIADQSIDGFVMPVMQHNVTTAASDGATLINQFIEDGGIDLLGQTVTLSFYAKTVSGSATITPSLEVDNGTYPFSGTAKTLTSSWQRFTQQFTLSGYTTSISNSRHLRVALSVSSGIANIQITGVQLEKGTVATTFEFRPYGAELALCQRYFQFCGAGVGFWYSNNSIYIASQFNPMRATPSVSLQGSYAVDYAFGAPGSPTGVITVSGNGSPYGAEFNLPLNTSTNMTNGQVIVFRTGAANSGIALSAEL